MKIANLINKKLLGLKYRRTRKEELHKANELVNTTIPEVLESFENFKKNGQISSDRQPIKGYDLWTVLERRKPRFIVELGSGTTSAVFASWANRNGAKYVSHESHDGWHKVTTESIGNIPLKNDSEIRYIPSVTNSSETATHFSEPIPEGADFVYIDGPPCKLESGKKVPNEDIIHFFETGARPKTIVIDGRVETADLIREHKAGKEYDFYPSFNYSILRNFELHKMSVTDHSVFELK